MKDKTIKVLFDDYIDYQKEYKKEYNWNMKESFKEYVQRCLDIDELQEYLDEQEL
tara:strand:- start:19 stop:183 length:165 start_codon:yes stop_codon:yes gene_type:complete